MKQAHKACETVAKMKENNLDFKKQSVGWAQEAGSTALCENGT